MPPDIRPASLVIDWTPETESRRWAGQSGCGRIQLKKICKKHVSVAIIMKLGVLPVTVPNRDNSLPSEPTGTGGHKCK